MTTAFSFNMHALDSVPESWDRRPLWSLLRRREVRNRPEAELLSVYREHGVVPKASREDNFNKPSEDLGSYKYVRRGDLVLNKMKTWQGSIAVSEYEGIVSPAYYVCEVSDRVDKKYLHYLLRSRPYIGFYHALSKGVRPNQWDLPFEDFRSLPVALPGIGEQRRIADFLDAETARVDQVVAVRRQQLDLLEERWRAGLSSRAERLGSEFGFLQLRHMSFGMEQGWSPQCEDRHAEEGQWGVLKAGCVNGGFFDWRQHKALPVGVAPKLQYRIAPGDLLISRASGSADLIGSSAVVPRIDKKLLLCDKVYRISLDRIRYRAEFVSCMLSSSQVRSLFESSISGGEGMANNLPASVVKRAPVPDAPLSVQSAELAGVERERGYQKNMSESLRRQISLLEERKSSLIAAAVTGQIDVTTARGADVS